MSDAFDWDRQPAARVERLGRWWHLVYIVHGMMRYGPEGHGWHVFGAKRAVRKAARLLARYEATEARRADVLTLATTPGSTPHSPCPPADS